MTAAEEPRIATAAVVAGSKPPLAAAGRMEMARRRAHAAAPGPRAPA